MISRSIHGRLIFKSDVIAAIPTADAAARINNIVLVHGAFVDGSGWQQVYRILTAKGFNVSVVQNPTTSLAADMAATMAVIDMQSGPVVLVGHSYGGVVITEAGNHPKVSRLVYIAAFAPDSGESVQKIGAHHPAGAPIPPLLAPIKGFLRLDKARFATAFAGDLNADRAAFLASAQQPLGVDAFTGEVTIPAWRSKPSWFLIATDDRMIPPVSQRAMARRAGSTVDQAAGSHCIHESHPDTVAGHIEKAAQAGH
ncbi:alpha/beta hydrolase [Duganella sp. SAP-35]|uniref:Alpha/beta hydrolase n=2 Tax=Duganella aceris TaxID=2703883 RepID=A0ABX0FUY8_9BURK|nr:alpha/beta hydrolase [Duganella aceris]